MRPLLLLAVLLVLVVVPRAGAWTWPASGPVLQPYDFDPAHPYAAGKHRGIDIAGDAGALVLAPATGTVTFAGTVPSSGRSITIATSAGDAVTLTHLGSLLVATGAAVAEGDGVGTIGASGDPEVAQPYVHLGVRIASEPQGYLDPLSVLPGRAAALNGPLPAPAEPGAGSTSDAPTADVAPPPAAPPVATSPVPTSHASASSATAAAPVTEPATAGPVTSPGARAGAVSSPAAGASASTTASRSAVERSSSFLVVRHRARSVSHPSSALSQGSAISPRPAMSRARGEEALRTHARVRGGAGVGPTRGSRQGSTDASTRGSTPGSGEPAAASVGPLSAGDGRPGTRVSARDTDASPPPTIGRASRPDREASRPRAEAILPIDRPAREPGRDVRGASAQRHPRLPAAPGPPRLGGSGLAAVLAMVVAGLVLGVAAALAAVRFRKAQVRIDD